LMVVKTHDPNRTSGARLRIVREAPGRSASEAPRREDARRVARTEVEHENISAAGNDALLHALLGPRQCFAHEVEHALQGGRAAIVTPDARDALVVRARGLGLREFDAHLIIATVQEAARRGERAWIAQGTHETHDAAKAGSHLHTQRQGLVVIGPGAALQKRRQEAASVLGSALIAVTLGLVGLASLIVMLGD
jgi:hypothetical protein